MHKRQAARVSIFRFLVCFAVCAAAFAQGGAERHDVFVAMDDGVRLNASVFVPEGTAADAGWPAIVFVHGLGGSKSIAAARRAAGRGYVGLAYTVRGQGRRKGGAPSGGFSTPVGEREARDLRAMLAWLRKNYPVDSRRIGITGSSQGGLHSWMAVAYEMGVAAAVPQNFTAELSRAVIINGGIQSRVIVAANPPLAYSPETIAQRRKAVVAYDAEALRESTAARDLRSRLRGATIPVMAQFAFEDGWGPANNVIDDFRELKGPRKLYLGTGGHGSPAVKAEQRFRQRWTDRWFDRWLRDERNGIDDEPPVEVAVMGSWRHLSLPSFPPPETQMTNYYLEGTGEKGGRLVREDRVDRHEYEKRNSDLQSVAPAGALTRQTLRRRGAASFGPAEFYDAGGRLRGPQGVLSRVRLDSLRYATAPLQRGVMLLGIPELQLAVSGSASRRQIAARLWDVAPGSGRRRQISRMSLTAGRENEWNGHAVRVEMSAAAYEVPAGHAIELELSNLDLAWDNAKQDWRGLWAIPLFDPGEMTVHTGEWLFSLLRLPEYEE